MADASWTWMIYLATHNNAAEVGEQSVARMRTIAPNQDVRVLVQQSSDVFYCTHQIRASPNRLVREDVPNETQRVPPPFVSTSRKAISTAIAP